jgi:hypothetical protein
MPGTISPCIIRRFDVIRQSQFGALALQVKIDSGPEIERNNSLGFVGGEGAAGLLRFAILSLVAAQT